MAFLPPSGMMAEPMLTFLWLSSESVLELQTRKLSLVAHSFNDASRTLDVVSPLRASAEITATTDFNDVPFSCPAARRVLPIPTSGNDKYALVIGDEHAVLYSISQTPQSPSASRRLSSSTNIGSSPRASATRRSPQTEMVGSVGKRQRKLSTASVSVGGGDKWEVRPVWRVRQGFGTVLA